LEPFEAAAAGLFDLAYRVAYRLTGDRQEAADIAQEALARALVRWSNIHAYPEAWVARTATNLALDLHRRRRRHRPALPAAGGPGPDGDRLDLVAALRRLPRRQREAVVLRYLADLDEPSVAATMGCSPGTVKQHLHRAVTALRADPLLSQPGA
jgi:RNA polymerase sigma-70 factor (sigma-E family)